MTKKATRHGQRAPGMDRITFDLPREIKESLRIMAERERRTLSNFLRLLVEGWAADRSHQGLGDGTPRFQPVEQPRPQAAGGKPPGKRDCPLQSGSSVAAETNSASAGAKNAPQVAYARFTRRSDANAANGA